MKNQKGQIILILVLVMTVALSIGISVTQRSLSDIATSTKVEESSRAFSAAEAGIDKAIQNNQAISNIPLGNESTIQSVTVNNIPAARQALEYPPITKEQFAHVWLANPQNLAQYYNQSSIEIYWGAANTDLNDPNNKPAIEVTVVYLSGGSYQSKKFFLDSNATRALSNKFQDASLGCDANRWRITTSEGDNRAFFCKTTLTGLTSTLMLLRARILYSSGSHPFAVQPLGGNCGDNTCSLPVQARTFTSTGIAGQTTRKVKVLRVDQVVPFYFDYGIFSAGEINK